LQINKIFDIRKKTIVITGGSGFLGSQYAEGLSKVGANVVIADINYEICKKLCTEIKKKFSTDPLPIKLDLTNPKSIERMVKTILKKYETIDVLINNAADQGNPKLRKTPFEDFPLKDWNKAIDVNLTGVFLCCQQIGKIMKKQRNGVIINISSTYGIVAPDQRIYGSSGQNSAAFYAASKSGILNLTRYLASYWQGTGIRVNTFSPGGVEKNQDPKFIKNYSKRTPLGRMAKKNEYIGPIIFLSSDASSYMTGSNLIVDGGWTAW
tara:strand:- start:1760 stop:2557 length:798 start_codon:yes stop_codon:yes gene_type:complete